MFGKKAAATVDIYEDFGCPICEQFEQSTHAWFQDAVRANLAQVRYHPISILDRRSTNTYSTRAANAAICASDVVADEFVAYHNLFYGKTPAGKQVQPTEGTAGPSDQQLISLRADRSRCSRPRTSTTFTTACRTEQHKALVEAITEQASKDGVNGTPTVYVNGKKVDATLAALKAAIAKADAAGPAPVAVQDAVADADAVARRHRPLRRRRRRSPSASSSGAPPSSSVSSTSASPSSSAG